MISLTFSHVPCLLQVDISLYLHLHIPPISASSQIYFYFQRLCPTVTIISPRDVTKCVRSIIFWKSFYGFDVHLLPDLIISNMVYLLVHLHFLISAEFRCFTYISPSPTNLQRFTIVFTTLHFNSFFYDQFANYSLWHLHLFIHRLLSYCWRQHPNFFHVFNSDQRCHCRQVGALIFTVGLV